MRHISPVIITVLQLAAGGGTLAAQGIVGRAADEATGRGVSNVEIILIDAEGNPGFRVLTDRYGLFRLQVPRPGTYSLRAERIGYVQTEAKEVGVLADEVVHVEIRLGQRAVPLEPLIVTGRMRRYYGPLADFQERAKRAARTGVGHVITRQAIEDRHPGTVTDVLRMLPRIRIGVHPENPNRQTVFMISAGRPCRPQIYVDGVQMRASGGTVDMVAAGDLEGVEVYRGFGEMPAEYYDDSGCGVVLLWTRRGS